MAVRSLHELYAAYGRLTGVKKRLFDKLAAEEGIDLRRVAILPQPRTQRDYPVSSAQARVFFFEQLHAGTAVYNVPSLVRLAEALRIDRLREALQQTVDRHEVLRLGFVLRGGLIRQVVHPTAAAAVDEVRVPGAREAERKSALQRTVHEFARAPFDLERPPLLRTLAVHAGGEQHVVFVMHHLVADALSVRLLVREVGRRYRCLLDGTPFDEPPAPIQYVDYALWEQAESGRASRAESVAYWRSALGGEMPRLELPADFPRPAARSHRGATYGFALDGRVAARLRAFAKAEGVTLFVALLTAYKLVLARICGVDDVSVAVPMSGRNRPELEELLGYFGNTVLVRTRLPAPSTVGEAVAAVQKAVVGAHAHQDVPFEEIVGACRRAHPRPDGAMYDVMFEFLDFRGPQPTPDAEWNAPMSLEFDVDVHTQTAKCDLFLCCWESEHGLSGVIEYDTDLFEQRTIAGWAGMYAGLLESLPEGRERAIADLAYGDGDRHRRLGSGVRLFDSFSYPPSGIAAANPE